MDAHHGFLKEDLIKVRQDMLEVKANTTALDYPERCAALQARMKRVAEKMAHMKVRELNSETMIQNAPRKI